MTFLFCLLLTVRSFGQQEPSSDLQSVLDAAHQAQAANNYAAAAASYKQAVALRPDVPELRANLGLMQHEAGDYPAAMRSFQETLQLKPSLYVPNLFLGIDYVRTGQPKQAVSLLLKAERMNAADPLPPLTLGHAYASLGEYDAAIGEFRRVLQLDPKRSSAWFSLGIAELHKVEEEARTVTGASANTAYAQALFAQALVEQSRYKEALELYRSLGAAKNAPPCMGSEAGFVSLRQKSTQEAERQFQAERRTHPECSLALLGGAALHIEAGANPQALQQIEQAWTADHGFVTIRAPQLLEAVSPEARQSFLAYLTAQRASGSLGEALYAVLTQPAQETITAEAGAAITPHAATSLAAEKALLRTRGWQAYREGQYARCADLLTGSLSSSDTAALETLAACSFFTGHYTVTSAASRRLAALPSTPQAAAQYWSIRANEKLALESLTHFEQLEPNSARSHLLLGDIYRQRRRYDDAQKEYAKALELSPNDTAALLGLASAYYGNANLEKAVETARQGLLASADDPELNLLMGEALTSQHKFAEAEPFLLKSLRGKPQVLPHVHALLGEAYAADGETQNAIRELQIGAESDQDGSLHFRLARLYKQTGDTAAATHALQQMKALQERRRQGAVIAVQDAHTSSLDDDTP